MIHLDEFSIIKRYFTHQAKNALLGVGDDCALLKCLPNEVLAISTDMLVVNQHFFEKTNPKNLGHKALAVNLSDLAAMGAKPLAFTLALALPEISPKWLKDFSKGMMNLAAKHNCDLIGGDITCGPLTISVTIFGLTSTNTNLLRSNAKTDDDIWISGNLGDARLALAILRGKLEAECDLLSIERLKATQLQQLIAKLEKPEPRIALGLGLLGLANAAIDISDGLAADLNHILLKSKCGATLYLDSIPHSLTLDTQSQKTQILCKLAGGDDYELCFTASTTATQSIVELGKHLKLKLSKIGKINTQTGLKILDATGNLIRLKNTGFKHFTANK